MKWVDVEGKLYVTLLISNRTNKIKRHGSDCTAGVCWEINTGS